MPEKVGSRLRSVTQRRNRGRFLVTIGYAKNVTKPGSRLHKNVTKAGSWLRSVRYKRVTPTPGIIFKLLISYYAISY